MMFDLPAPETLYAALQSRDPAYEGRAWVGVRTTGIFCRLTCPARDPKFENCTFHDSVAACLEAGFRPCKRCKPLTTIAAADTMVTALLDALQTDPGKRWSERDLTALGHDPSTVRRAFRRHFGVTFLDMARLSRMREAAASLAKGAPVIEAQLDGVFASPSGFRTAFARLLGQPPGAFTGDERLRADWIDTPIGQMVVVADKDAVRLLEFTNRKALRGELAALQKGAGGAIGLGRFAPSDRIEAELSAYFAGQNAGFTTPLAPLGTPFQRHVWNALRNIPAGQTHSYSDLARRLDQPTATRAVARANGANPIALVIPCHRLIGADGSLTGYGGGLWRKRWLIAHEAAMARAEGY